MRREFRELTYQQRSVFSAVAHYYETLGEPVPASYVARRFSISHERARQYFQALNKLGWLRTSSSPATPLRRLPPCRGL